MFFYEPVESLQVFSLLISRHNPNMKTESIHKSLTRQLEAKTIITIIPFLHPSVNVGLNNIFPGTKLDCHFEL